MVTGSLIAVVGFICAAMIAIGFGFVVPVSSVVGDFFDVLAVMPIDTTIDKVHKAAELIDAGKYYEGGQELRMAQADERFNMVGNLGTPKE